MLIGQSQVIADQLRLSNDLFNLQRLRDFRVHILEERHRRSGYYWAELAGIALYRRHDQLRWFVDARFKADHDDPFIDGAIADSAGYGFQEVNNTVEHHREKYDRPLRERKKPGRKPIGLIAQTTAERVRKHRRNKSLKRSPPTSVATAGTEQPMPLGPTVPTAISTHVQGGNTT